MPGEDATDRRPRFLLGHALVLGAAVVFAAGCQEELPTAPNGLVDGITVYNHAGFSGESAHLTADVSDLSDYKGPCQHTTSSGYSTSYYYDWNDCISSIKVAPGWQATVYVDSGFHEDWLDVVADISDLGQVRGYCHDDTWNDCISSIRVKRQ